jgi:large subunit ribosomal protein L35
MPKMKTNSAASKRVRVTATGKVMHAGSGMRHNLEHKSARKRRELKRRRRAADGQAKKMKKPARLETEHSESLRNKDFRKLRNHIWHVSSAQ